MYIVGPKQFVAWPAHDATMELVGLKYVAPL